MYMYHCKIEYRPSSIILIIHKILTKLWPLCLSFTYCGKIQGKDIVMRSITSEEMH